MKIRKTINEKLDYGTISSEKNAFMANCISALIRDEWEAIDGYMMTIQDMTRNKAPQAAIEILQSIMAEEHAHVGELQKALALINPDSEHQIEHGEQEAEEIIK
jgi:bacterioferritin (cytochrome b1)